MSAARTSDHTASGITSPLLKRLYGWSARESAGTPAAAKVRLRRGSVSGEIIAEVGLVASGSDGMGGLDIPVPEGIFVEVLSGSAAVVVYGG